MNIHRPARTGCIAQRRTPSGYLTTHEDDTARRLAEGVDFVAVTIDGASIAQAASSLMHRLRRG